MAYVYSSMYDALAAHIGEGRLAEEDAFDHERMVGFLARADAGGDADWQAIDAALDHLAERYLAEVKS